VDAEDDGGDARRLCSQVSSSGGGDEAEDSDSEPRGCRRAGVEGEGGGA
jgi:hypothetical protein